MINWFLTRMLTIHCEKSSLFNKRCCDNWIFTCERRKLNSYLTLQTTINLIRYLKVLGKNTTLLEENTLGSLYNFGLCNEFSVMTLKRKVKLNWTLMEFKNICTAEEHHTKKKWKECTELEKISANHVYSISRIHKKAITNYQ